ncbi:lipoprotein [Klebsiella aerogenes]|nr:lipoprotein [Klebsiella aerogenes]
MYEITDASLAAIVMLAGCSAQGDTASQQRASIQKMRSETLNKLYALQPEARSDIQHAKGYAVFANNSSKILLFGLAAVTAWCGIRPPGRIPI